MTVRMQRRSQSVGQRIRVLREAPPDRIAVEITDPDRRYTWHPWDPDPHDRPQDLTFGYEQPGGDGDADTVLARRPGQDYPDTERLNTARIYGPGNDTLWEGLITQPSRSWGELQIQVKASGWKQTLNWSPTLRMPYVDRDLSHWGNVANPRRVVLYGLGFETVGDVSVEPDTATGLPALMLKFTGTGAAMDGIAEALYDSGATIGSIYYDYTSNGTLSTYSAGVGVATTDAIGTLDISGDLLTGTNSSGTGTLTATAGNRRFGFAQILASGITPTDGDHVLSLRYLTVFGNHSLTKQGTAPNQGYLGSDIMNHGLISLGCPLTWTTGTNGTLQPTTFTLEHFDIGRDEGADAEQLILALDRFEGRAWGVHARELFWRPRGSGRKWRLRRSQTSFSEEGESDESAFNGVVVYYTDPAGSTYSVGPTDSGAFSTDSDLMDSSETNPVNERGLGKKYLTVKVDGMTTLAMATEIGVIVLREMSRPTRGTANVTGLVEDSRGTLAWPWQIKDDDVVVFADEIGGPERIVTGMRYSAREKSAQVELDGPEKRLDVLLARLQVSVQGLGVT